MVDGSVLQHQSLREQVYEYLRSAINCGELDSGSFLDLNRLGAELGISRTPLRDALIQLECEGFVSILPRRGVLVNRLQLDDIRHIYEIVGGLESAAVLAVGQHLGDKETATMRSLNRTMETAIGTSDFDTYYAKNLAFHDTFLRLSDNVSLVRMVENRKHRLYDFPRRETFVAEWEEASIREHDAIVDYLQADDPRGAADYLRDVHWSFEVQKPFIMRYYFPSGEERGHGGRR